MVSSWTYKVARCSELLVSGKAIYVRAQKLIKTLDKIYAFSVIENMERINPSARLCSCCSVMRVGRVSERNIGKKIRNTKLLEVRHAEGEMLKEKLAAEDAEVARRWPKSLYLPQTARIVIPAAMPILLEAVLRFDAHRMSVERPDLEMYCSKLTDYPKPFLGLENGSLVSILRENLRWISKASHPAVKRGTKQRVTVGIKNDLV